MTLEQRRKIINEIIQKCYSRLYFRTKSDFAIMGYCVCLANTIAINEDGSIWAGFIQHKNNEQWRAEELVREVIKEIKEVQRV
jgi:hypothetical protein